MPTLDVAIDAHTTDVEVDVYCDDCGDPLEAVSGVPTGVRERPGQLLVSACSRCLQNAVSEATERSSE